MDKKGLIVHPKMNEILSLTLILFPTPLNGFSPFSLVAFPFSFFTWLLNFQTSSSPRDNEFLFRSTMIMNTGKVKAHHRIVVSNLCIFYIFVAMFSSTIFTLKGI